MAFPSLTPNEIFSSLMNMFISQQVFSDDVKVSGSLVNRFRVDGTLYGDTKLYYAGDVLKSFKWVQDDDTKYSLLTRHRPQDPEVQAIRIDTFRQIPLTTDEYMTKRAWMDSGAFGQFNSRLLQFIRDTKKVYDHTLFNAHVGTVIGGAVKSEVDIEIPEADSGNDAIENEAINRLRGLKIGQGVADLLVELTDVSRDYNDYAQLKSYENDDFLLVLNSKYANEIRHVDLPTVFHKAGIQNVEIITMPAKYFGEVKATVSAGAVPSGLRLLEEMEYKVATDEYHGFAGDLVATGTLTSAEATALSGKTYVEKDDVIGKLLHKDSLPFMSAFETGTEFWDAKNLSRNHYLTWGYSSPTYLKARPVIKLSETNPQ